MAARATNDLDDIFRAFGTSVAVAPCDDDTIAIATVRTSPEQCPPGSIRHISYLHFDRGTLIGFLSLLDQAAGRVSYAAVGVEDDPALD